MSDRGFRRRVRDFELGLHALLPGQPTQTTFYSLVCDGCGRMAVTQSLDDLADATRDWRRSAALGGADYCDRCCATIENL